MGHSGGSGQPVFPCPFPCHRAALLLHSDSQEGPIRKAGEYQGVGMGGYFLMYKRDIWALKYLIYQQNKILVLKKVVLWLKKFKKVKALKTVYIATVGRGVQCRGHLLHRNFWLILKLFQCVSHR